MGIKEQNIQYIRRLPLFVILDEADESNNDHLGTEIKRGLLSYFNQDPFLLERLYISFSILTKDGLYEINSYKELFESSCNIEDKSIIANNLSDAFSCLINKYVNKTTAFTKGDWIPTFVIFNINKNTSYTIQSPNKLRIISVSNHVLTIDSKYETWHFRMVYTASNINNIAKCISNIISPHALAIGQSGYEWIDEFNSKDFQISQIR